MLTLPPRSGAGGGGSSAKAGGKESPDTLQTTQTAQIKDILGVGPIRGLADQVLSNVNQLLWGITTVLGDGVRFVMQGDGNLVLYNAIGTVLWASDTDGNPGASLVIQGDGNLVIYSAWPAHAPLWASDTNDGSTGDNIVVEGGHDVLVAGQTITFGIHKLSLIGGNVSLTATGSSLGVGGTGFKSIAYDFTRVQNEDGTYNFAEKHDPAFPSDPDKKIPSKMGIHVRTGTQDQEPVTGFDFEAATSSEHIQLRKASPYVRQFTNPNLNAVRIDMLLPQMRKAQSNNDIVGTSVSLKFEMKVGAGPYVERINHTITGKGQGNTITFHMDVPDDRLSTEAVFVRVTRITSDSTTVRINNDTWVESYTEIVNQRLSHPLIAYVAQSFEADQFSTIPSRSFDVFGLLIEIPTNYDGDSRTYATSGAGTSGGLWDGTFKQGWTDNNAWICWYLLRNAENALGQYIDPAILDAAKWDFYACAKVCDANNTRPSGTTDDYDAVTGKHGVPDGFGGFEPRYTCNTVVSGRESAARVLSDFFGSMNAAVAYVGGQVVPVQDRYVPPTEYADVYVPSNVEDGEFEFSSTGERFKHTTALIEWNDQNDFGRPKSEYCEIESDLKEFGDNQLQVTGIGIASRGQAHRKGLMMLWQERLRIESVVFKSGLQGASNRPGDVLPISVPFRSGKISHGRLKGGTTTTADLDRQVTIVGGVTYTLMYTDTAGANVNVAIGNTAGTYSTLNFTAAQAHAPLADSPWILSESGLVPELFSALRVKLIDELKTEIAGITYDPTIYARVEGGVFLENRPTSILPDPNTCPPVRNVNVTRVSGVITGVVKDQLVATWEPPINQDGTLYPFVRNYRLSFRFNGGRWQSLPETPSTSIEWPVGGLGTYDIEVVAINIYNGNSPARAGQYIVTGQAQIPEFHVTHLQLVNQASDGIFQQRDAKFSWMLASLGQALSQDEGTAHDGAYDPLFVGFQVQIVNPATELVVWGPSITTDPNFIYTLEMNREAMKPANAIATFRIEVRAIDALSRPDLKPAKLTVTNPDPPAPTDFISTSSFKAAFLAWTKPSVVDLDYIEVWMNTADDITTAIRILQTISSGETITGLTSGTDYYFWLYSVDTFGNKSDATAASHITPGVAAITDIEHFFLDASSIFSEAIIPQGAIWTNGPLTSISWNAHQLYYRGVGYAIAAGSTSSKYVYWNTGDAFYSSSDTKPTMTNAIFIIALNQAGVAIVAWNNGIANAVIGTANILDAAIVHAKIAALAVDDGNIVNLNAAKITAGILDAARIAAGSITADKLLAGSITVDKLAAGIGESLHKNGSFEQGGVGWSQTGAIITGLASHGQKFSESIANTPTYLANMTDLALAQWIPVRAGGLYYMACDLYTADLLSTFWIGFYGVTADGATVTEITPIVPDLTLAGIGIPSPVASTWYRVDKLVQLAANTHWVALHIWHNRGSRTGVESGLDNVYFGEAVTDTLIASISANKIKTNSIFSNRMILDATGEFVSSDYVAGAAGSQIKGGRAEFGTVVVRDAVFDNTVAALTIGPSTLRFTTSGVTITISGAPSGWTIRYTLDGTAVTPTSSVYTGSFSITDTITVRAVAYHPSLPRATPPASQTYTKVPVDTSTWIKPPPPIPTKMSGSPSLGSNGYKVIFISPTGSPADETYYSVNGGAYTLQTTSGITLSAGDYVVAYDHLSAGNAYDSDTFPFYNTAVSGGSGGATGRPPGHTYEV